MNKDFLIRRLIFSTLLFLCLLITLLLIYVPGFSL